MGGWYNDMMSGWGGGWMWGVWIILIGLLVWGVVALTRRRS